MTSKWVFASCLLSFAAVSSAQVIFYPPIIREFVDHPFNARLNSGAAARLASLQEPGGAEWAADEVYVNDQTGERVWPVDSNFDEKFGDRVRLSNQPLYFRKGDLLPKDGEEDRIGDDDIDTGDDELEMIDVRDLDADRSGATTPATRPAATAARSGELAPGEIVIIPSTRKANRTSDNGDRVTD